jgi:hypothetical protein
MRAHLVFTLAACSAASLLFQCSSGDSSSGGGPSDGGGTDGTLVEGSAGDANGTDAGTDGASGGDSGSDSSSNVDACATCGTPNTCCSGICTNLKKDPKNCGACGTACNGSQFCNGTACNATIFSNICASANGTVMVDQFPSDNDAGSVLGTALQGCDGGVTIRYLGAAAPGVLDDAGRPSTGPGDMLVVPGGPFPQPAAKYLDTASLSPIYTRAGAAGTFEAVERKTDLVVKNWDPATLGAGHDYFILELAVEPTTGTLSMVAYGMFGPGTAAAAYFASTEVIPKRGSYTDAWYFYEWQDGNANNVPDAFSEFTLVKSGK